MFSRNKILAICLCCIFAISAEARIYVIVNKNSSISSISRSTLKRVYLGKTMRFPGSSKSFYPVELSARSAVRTEFLRKVMHMKSSLLMQYRSRLIFSGKGRVPISVGSQSSVESIVGRKKNAIGYVSRKPNSSKVKVILTL